MKLTWNGHSCFTLEAEEGTLVLDPYGDGQACRRIADAIEWRYGMRSEPPADFQTEPPGQKR